MKELFSSEEMSPTEKRRELLRLSDLYLRGKMSIEDFRQVKKGLLPDYSAMTRGLDWWPGVQMDLKDVALKSAGVAVNNFLSDLGRWLAK